MGCSFSYGGPLSCTQNSPEQLGHLKGSFMGLLFAGSFYYYGHPTERQKRLPRGAADIIFNQHEFFPGLALKVFVGLPPCGICFSQMSHSAISRSMGPSCSDCPQAISSTPSASASDTLDFRGVKSRSHVTGSRHTGRTLADIVLWLLRLVSQSNCTGR